MAFIKRIFKYVSGLLLMIPKRVIFFSCFLFGSISLMFMGIGGIQEGKLIAPFEFSDSYQNEISGFENFTGWWAVIGGMIIIIEAIGLFLFSSVEIIKELSSDKSNIFISRLSKVGNCLVILALVALLMLFFLYRKMGAL